MVQYTKTIKSPEELVQLLISRGLEVKDIKRAERYIENIGYYRLSAYMYPFLVEPKTDHIYKQGVSFDNILRLYRFDKKLRVLLFNEIEKIEIAFRSSVVNITTSRASDSFWMTKPEFVNPKTLELIEKEYNHSTEALVSNKNWTN